MSKRICVFGSSIGHGHSDIEGGGWCNRLKVYYFATDDFSIYNLSISGAMSTNTLDRFDNELSARNPKFVLLAIGSNDSTFDEAKNSCRVPIEKTKENISKMIEIANNKQIKIMVIGFTRVNEKLVCPVPWATNLSYKNKYIQQYDNIIKEVAQNNNVPYCYMYDLLKNEDLDDGLHPNAQGHKKMFERIKNFLIENNL